MLQCSLCKRWAGPEDDGWETISLGPLQGKKMCNTCNEGIKKTKMPVPGLDFSPHPQALQLTPDLKKLWDKFL